MAPKHWWTPALLVVVTLGMSQEARPEGRPDTSASGDLALEAVAGAEVSLANWPRLKRALALDVAGELGRDEFRSLVASRLSATTPRAHLNELLRDYADTWPSEGSRRLAERVARLDEGMRAAKGVEARLDSLLEIRLADPLKAARLATDRHLLVAYAPPGNEKSWKVITAFDQAGAPHRLPVWEPPSQTVLVVGLDAEADLKAGLTLLNEGLRVAGLQPEEPRASTAGIPTSKLTKISMQDDQEPWIKGAAEVYALVAGVDPSRDQASIAAVDLPYLDYDGRTYYPNQIVIFWSNYRYAAADILFYEHDDNYNYQTILAMLVEGIGTFVPEYNWAFVLASKIIQLMPGSWFTDDDDYCDVFYTLERDQTYTDYWGASSNVRFSLVPYTLQQ